MWKSVGAVGNNFVGASIVELGQGSTLTTDPEDLVDDPAGLHSVHAFQALAQSNNDGLGNALTGVSGKLTREPIRRRGAWGR